MELRSIFAAAAVFLALSCMKWMWPGFTEQALQKLQAQLGRETLVVYVSEEVASWAGLD